MKKIIALFLIILGAYSCATNDGQLEPGSLKIATFNMEWLGDGVKDMKPRDSQDYKKLAEIIRNTQADIIAVQEIENATALQKVLAYLPGYSFALSNDEWIQKCGIIYKTGIEAHIVGDYYPIAVKPNRTRPGLVVNFKKDNFDFTMMCVHFKSTSSYDSTDEMRKESYELRKEQSSAVFHWADSILKNSPEKDIIIAGDFNDNPLRKKYNNLASMTTGNELTFLTQELKSCKNEKWDAIDHIVVSESIMKRYLANSDHYFDIYYIYKPYEVKKLSDHCPVIVSFDSGMPDND